MQPESSFFFFLLSKARIIQTGKKEKEKKKKSEVQVDLSVSRQVNLKRINVILKP